MNRNQWIGGSAVAAVAALGAGLAAAQGGIVRCESINYRNTECRIDGRPVALVRQLSTPPGDCIEGRTWGYNDANSTVWVSNGCRAEFQVGRGSGAARIVLFENDGFNGRTFRASNSVSNLGQTDFNDRASSVVVDGGRWQICSDAFFGGQCVTLGPGRYPSLRDIGLNDKVSSVRALGWTPDGGGGWGGGNGGQSGGSNGGNHWGGGGNWGSGARAVLYRGRDLTGEIFVVGAGGVSSLGGTGFNDRASSLRIESGYWLFCSDANFQGECRTFGPGDYPALPPGLENRISSGRQISRDYPYRQNPNWGN